MRLYKMELYKICHKKIFIVGVIGMLLIILFTFLLEVTDERATVDGVTYTGYRAAQVNREITNEFQGVLTDEKAERIIEKYGFPDKREEGWNHFRNGNFLNFFVMNYLSDGYMYSYEDYRVGSQVYPIADTDLGAIMEITGKEIILEYYRGWEVFLNVFSLGMILGSIVILFGISTVFANEGQTRMLQLLFTTKEGKRKDIAAKVEAAFTIAFMIWLGILVLILLLCGIVYGLDGLHCYNGMVTGYLMATPDRMLPMYDYLTIALLLSFFGILFLCALTICISAHFKSAFHSVIVAAVCWLAPVLAAMFTDGLRGLAKLLSAAPVFMVIHEIVSDIYNIWLLPIGIALILSILCTFLAYRKYKGQQTV